MEAGYWAFLHICNFCECGSEGNLERFIAHNPNYTTTVHIGQ